MTNPDEILIYHITSIDNLPKILQCNGLWCDEQRIEQNFSSVNIAHQEIKERRRQKQIPLPTHNELLSNYVPFYFCNRSPMLYTIHNGNVLGYAGTQQNIIYLVSSVNRVISTNCKWCFTDGHAIEEITQFYDSVYDLNKVDRQVINDWSWKNTKADNDRKRRKQAEFLVYKAFLWNWVERIGVISQDYVDRVNQLLKEHGHKPIVEIKKEWYYTHND